MKDRLLTGLEFVLVVPYGSDLIRGLTTADFHQSWNFPVFSDRFMILVRVSMQCLRTFLSSFVGMVSVSHDFWHLHNEL